MTDSARPLVAMIVLTWNQRDLTLDRLGKQGREDVLAHWSWDRAVQALENHLSRAGQGIQ